MLFVTFWVRSTSKESTFYWSDRIELNNEIIKMSKFRTMRVDTPAVTTHFISDSVDYLSSIGGFLCRTSLDEMSQFSSILKEDMSFIVPRPGFFNQAY